MSSNRIVYVCIVSAVAIGCLAASIVAQVATRPSPSDVVRMKLPKELPAIGNVDDVKNWRFGRIESVVQTGGSDDVKINIRIEDGRVLETIGPRVLSDLARASNWVSAEASKEQIFRADYVERMIAFDVDANNRIIAMISMEPIDRDRRRLQRGL